MDSIRLITLMSQLLQSLKQL